MRGILPLLGGLIMYLAGGWSLWSDCDVATGNSFTSWTMPFYPHWQIGGTFVIVFLSALVGLLVYIYCRFTLPAFFKKQTLTRATPTLVPETPKASPVPTNDAVPGRPPPPGYPLRCRPQHRPRRNTTAGRGAQRGVPGGRPPG